MVDAGEQAGLGDEAGQAAAVGGLILLRQDGDGIVVETRRQAARKEFLDRPRLVQRVIPCLIDDRKAAAADDTLELEFANAETFAQGMHILAAALISFIVEAGYILVGGHGLVITKKCFWKVSTIAESTGEWRPVTPR